MGEAIGFEFDGVRLDALGSEIVYFNNLLDETVSLGSTMTALSYNTTNRPELIWAKTNYDTQLSINIQIGKSCSSPDHYYTEEEIRKHMKFLNRPDGYNKLYFYDKVQKSEIFYLCQLNLSEIKYGGKTIGFDIAVTTNSPWSYIEKEYSHIFTSLDDLSYDIIDDGDNVWKTGIVLNISNISQAELTIKNSLNGSEINLTGCSSDEIIVIDGNLETIKSNKSNIQDRFNWVFPEITNTLINGIEDKTNTITVNCLCKIEFYWREKRKVGVRLWV